MGKSAGNSRFPRVGWLSLRAPLTTARLDEFIILSSAGASQILPRNLGAYFNCRYHENLEFPQDFSIIVLRDESPRQFWNEICLHKHIKNKGKKCLQDLVQTSQKP